MNEIKICQKNVLHYTSVCYDPVIRVYTVERNISEIPIDFNLFSRLSLTYGSKRISFGYPNVILIFQIGIPWPVATHPRYGALPVISGNASEVSLIFVLDCTYLCLFSIQSYCTEHYMGFLIILFELIFDIRTLEVLVSVCDTYLKHRRTNRTFCQLYIF